MIALRSRVPLRKWKNGTVHWRNLTNEEYTRHENDHNEQIECGEITVHKHQSHSDMGSMVRIMLSILDWGVVFNELPFFLAGQR